MSLRKIISLLLLVSFTFTTISPAFATTTVALSPSTLPTLAEDVGTVATQGANIDVVPAGIRITATAQTDVVFCGDSDKLLTDDASPSQYLVTTANGKLLVNTATANVDFGASRCVAGFAPPAGTRFVKLTSASYTDTTTNGTAYTGDNGGSFFRNATVSNTALLPGVGTNGDAIVATVLDTVAAATLFGTNSTSLPAGSLVLSFITPLSATTDLASTGTLNITLTGIGLASDGNGLLAESGNLTATYIAPDAGTQTNGQAAFPNLDTATTFNIVTLGPSGDKLEAIKVGTKTGNDGSTVVAEPDAQPNTLLASLVTGSTVKVGPGEITSGGSSSFLDTDAIVIRAKERPDSAASAITYYQTPFETSKFVLASALSNSGANADTLSITSVSDSSSYPNQDALITVTFSLEDGSGGASTATLAVDAANVTLHGARAFNSIRGAGATAGGQTTAVTSPLGFLGAAINLENGTTSGYTNYTAAVLYNGATTVDNYDVADVAVLNHDVLATKHGQTQALLYTAAYDSATAIHNGTTALGIFPGSVVTNGTVASLTTPYNLVNTANGTGISSVHSASFATTTGFDTLTLLATPTGLTGRLLNGTAGASIGNTAYFILSGNDAGNALNTAGLIKVGATNIGASNYFTGFTAQTTSATVPLNNLIMAAELEGPILKIMPVTNKYDGIRDALSIRPEATITVDAAALAAGVNLVATISGNNIAASTKITLATLLAAGSLNPTIDVTATALPVHGDMSSDNDLMKESATDAGASRSALDISSVTGASTSTDALADQITTGLALDDTTPPLFCGGSVGTATRGPNGLVVQPKARALLLTENGATGFDDIEDLGSNTVIRYTLPAGWDFNTYNASVAVSQIIGLETSGGLSASIARIQGVATGFTSAFIDVGSVTSSSTTVTTNRLLGLFLKPHALLVPSDATEFTVSIDIIDNKGTSAVTDDVVAGSLGTVALATECSTFLTVAFCPDALSDFDDTTVTTPVLSNVESTKITRGARQTTFASAVGPALRLVEGTPEVITLPDICITEGVADAFPLGSHTSAGSTGVPTGANAFGDVTPTNVTVHIATNFAGDSTDSSLLNVGINGATAAANIVFSDDSIQSDTAVTRISGNEVYFEIDTRVLTGNQLPFEETTEIRVPGLQLSAPATAKTFSVQDLIVWVEAGTAGTTAATAVIGNSLGRSLSEVTASTNEYFMSPFGTASVHGQKMRNNFATKVQDTTTSAPTAVNWGDNVVSADNSVTATLAASDPATLSTLTRSEVDSASNFLEISGDTEVSVLTSEINGVTAAVNALVSVGPGTLEPGTLIAVDGTIDDVTVPVLADGSFQANIRCAAGTTINLTQTPESAAVTTPAIASATCDDANVEPILLSATFVDSGLGTLTSRGTSPVVFQVVASGKLGTEDFIPTADQLTLGGNPVTAVAGTTDKFIGIVNFNKSSGKVVATTAGDGSTVTLTLGTNSTPPSISGGVPTLSKVKLNKKGTKVILRGLRLGNNGVAHFILDDGTSSAIDLVNRNSKDAQIGRRRGEVGSSIPSNATHAVFHNSGRGMSAVEL